MILDVEARVKLEADLKSRLHLNTIQTVRAFWIRSREINTAENTRVFPEHSIAALHWKQTERERKRI